MATDLQYLNNTFYLESRGRVTFKGRDDRGAFLILDQTIFYPQGGGQMADRGTLVGDRATEISEVPVTFVGFRDGEVLHYLPEHYFGLIELGQSFQLKVDRNHRIQNAMLHTAGHLVSHVLETMQPLLIPIKGYHFSDGPYVEFINNRSIDVAQLLEQANDVLAQEVAQPKEVKPFYSDFDMIRKLRPSLAPFIPADKPSRLVAIGDFVPLPCGGTHLNDLNQIGAVRVIKTKRVKENTRVSYEVTKGKH